MTEHEQPDVDSHLEWAADGAVVLSRAYRVLVVVDVLRFTTAVEVAVAHGARVAPARWRDRDGGEGGGAGALPDPTALPRPGPDSLSPVSLLGIPSGTRLELASPNGAMVTLAAAEAGAVVLAGCLRNASAVAAAARRLGAAPDLASTLAGCTSGRELIARGLAADLDLAAEHDVSQTVPRLLGGAFTQPS